MVHGNSNEGLAALSCDAIWIAGVASISAWRAAYPADRLDMRKYMGYRSHRAWVRTGAGYPFQIALRVILVSVPNNVFVPPVVTVIVSVALMLSIPIVGAT